MMIEKRFYLGFGGFVGFLTLKYFVSGDVNDLHFVFWFALFAEFFIGRIKGDKADERYLDNQRRAKAFAFDVAIAVVACFYIFSSIAKDLVIASFVLPLIYAIVYNVYGITLYRLEEK